MKVLFKKNMSITIKSNRFVHCSGNTELACGSDGHCVVTGGIDGHVNVSKVGTQGHESDVFEYHRGPVTCVAADHDRYFASGSEDGSIILYRYPHGEYMSHLLRLALSIRQITFSPNGNSLTVIGNDLEIRQVDLDGNHQVSILGTHSKTILSIRHDPLGRYLASLDLGGTVQIFDNSQCVKVFSKMVDLAKYSLADKIQLAWHPSGKYMVVPNGDHLLRIDEAWKMKSIQLCGFDKICQVEFSEAGLLAMVDKYDFAVLDSSFAVLSKVKGETEISGIGWLPRTSAVFCTNTNGQLLEYKVENVQESKPPNCVLATDPVVRSPVQAPFQPGSTSGSYQRYLSVNMVGKMVYRREEDKTMVDIEFNDRESLRPIRLPSQEEFSLGALGTTGAVLVSRQRFVHFVGFESWTSKADWVLETDQEIVGVAITRKSAVIVDFRNLVKVFSLSGIQTMCFELEGEFIACCGELDHVMFVFQGSKSPEYLLYNLETWSATAKGRVPTDEQTQLSWIGFSENHVPIVGTTHQIFKGLFGAIGWQWIPILDLSAYSHYWPVGFTDTECLCYLISDKNQLPGPAIKTVPIKLPLVGGEQWIRHCLAKLGLKNRLHPESPVQDHDLKRQNDKILLELIKDAIKVGRTAQAFDYFQWLISESSKHMARQLAHYGNERQLLDRMEEKENGDPKKKRLNDHYPTTRPELFSTNQPQNQDD